MALHHRCGHRAHRLGTGNLETEGKEVLPLTTSGAARVIERFAPAGAIFLMDHAGGGSRP